METTPSKKRARDPDSDKRKYDRYDLEWENAYFSVQWGSETALCVICNKQISCRKFVIQRHYQSLHESTFRNITGQDRIDKLAELKKTVPVNQDYIENGCTDTVAASYDIALILTKKGLPFSSGKVVKECMLAGARRVCPVSERKFDEISLSRNTIARRVEDLNANIEHQLKAKISEFLAYSLAADESTDSTDTAQLAVFIRGVNDKFECTEELLELVPMKGRTTGADILTSVETSMDKMEVPWQLLWSVTTDGAPAMTGPNVGFAGLVQKKVAALTDNLAVPEAIKIVFVHCIIHEEALCAKCFNFEEVMKVVVKNVNAIRAHALNHRQFKTFLCEVEADCVDLPYYTAVRWLSRGGMLSCFFQLRTEIEMFLVEKGYLVPELNDPAWLSKLAFLADVTSHLNVLNLQLQGKNKLAPEMWAAVKAFQRKLTLWKEDLMTGDVYHFACLKSLPGREDPSDLSMFANMLEDLREEFERRFSAFRSLEGDFALFEDLFSVDVRTAPKEVQNELIDLQEDNPMRRIFEKSTSIHHFYASFNRVKYPRLSDRARKVMCMFGSSYVCESLFSVMNKTKSKERNRLSDGHLNAVLRLSTTQITPDIDAMIKAKKCEYSHTPSSSAQSTSWSSSYE